ncbi:arginase family-domain-containing protein [Cantharellus anzutake]|uniref:arginase family-domain-containing protein n=1 Tax=Cantharellus anzutake TaxID=1750568 RepID=UPI00190755E3|nr:arginase family-domain-containing protein [Cantharellus anzutake]KAF8336573.1 arginase family-domain-containing protein [Cantharellus anzutake]
MLRFWTPLIASLVSAILVFGHLEHETHDHVQVDKPRIWTEEVFTSSPVEPSRSEEEYAFKFGPQVDLPFSGPLSFAHLPYIRCLDDIGSEKNLFDIAILGMPFDTSVSYRPGARFGPHGIRSGSRRLRRERGYSLAWEASPYSTNDTTVLDCGDVPISPFDNSIAVAQMAAAYSTLLARPVANPCTESIRSSCVTKRLSIDGKDHPRIVTLGGDHAVVLPILQSLHKVYGRITVIHFDSHLDTWPAQGYYGNSEDSLITHGTFFWTASYQGLLAKGTCVHAGIRCNTNIDLLPFQTLQDIDDLVNDEEVGFAIITTDDIDDIGPAGIAKLIRDHVGDGPIYLSLDIDVIDPVAAPATGTPEPAGWTPRELNGILRGLAGLNFVGMDIVEVAPAYDTNAETTGLVAAGIVHEFLSMFIADTPPKGFKSSLRLKKGSGI